MSATSRPQSQPQVSGGRLRNAATGGLFALVLIVPRIMHLRRNPRSWMFFRVFLEIVVAEITSVQAEESHGRWFLRVNWANRTAVFAYRGAFGEHLARVAETTIRSVMRPALPVLPQRRAAGA